MPVLLLSAPLSETSLSPIFQIRRGEVDEFLVISQNGLPGTYPYRCLVEHFVSMIDIRQSKSASKTSGFVCELLVEVVVARPDILRYT